MSTIEEAREQAREALELVHTWLPVPGSTVRDSDSGVRDSDSEESEDEK